MVRILGGMVGNRSAEMLVYSIDVEDRRWFASAFWRPQLPRAVLLAAAGRAHVVVTRVAL